MKGEKVTKRKKEKKRYNLPPPNAPAAKTPNLRNLVTTKPENNAKAAVAPMTT